MLYRNNTGVGLELMESNNYVIRNCTFENNVPPLISNQSAFGNLKLNPDVIHETDLNRIILSGGGLTIYSVSTLNALVEDCTFRLNSASNQSIHPNRPPLFQLDGHGGAAFIRLTNLNSSSVVFRNTIFDTNSAQIGGGAVYLTVSNGASNNSIIFDGCMFRKNSVIETSGGAISVVLYNSTLQNEIMIQDCMFEDNSAVGGGAIGVVVYDVGDSQLSSDVITIKTSVFRKNHGVKEGSAVGLFSLIHEESISNHFKIQIADW